MPGVSMERTYVVEGMSCGHCKVAVEAAVAELPGVERATVDLEAGVVTVWGDSIGDAAVRVAVDEAGYAVLS